MQYYKFDVSGVMCGYIINQWQNAFGNAILF